MEKNLSRPGNKAAPVGPVPPSPREASQHGGRCSVCCRRSGIWLRVGDGGPGLARSQGDAVLLPERPDRPSPAPALIVVLLVY